MKNKKTFSPENIMNNFEIIMINDVFLKCLTYTVDLRELQCSFPEDEDEQKTSDAELFHM